MLVSKVQIKGSQQEALVFIILIQHEQRTAGSLLAATVENYRVFIIIRESI